MESVITASKTNASLVIVHEIVLASAEDRTSALAAKRVSLLALDALEGDPDFMRCTCDCRVLSQAKRAQKKAQARKIQVQAMLVGFSAEEEQEIMAVEGALEEQDEDADVDVDADVGEDGVGSGEVDGQEDGME